jgi:hypothetical protein
MPDNLLQAIVDAIDALLADDDFDDWQCQPLRIAAEARFNIGVCLPVDGKREPVTEFCVTTATH